MESKTLKEAMPSCLADKGYEKTQSYKMQDILVVREHCSLTEQDEYQFWPGKHKNVFFWVELENGYVCGWNENPSRGWSFPVMKNPKE